MKKIVQLLLPAFIFISCQKELVDVTGGSGGGTGTPGTVCTGTKKYLLTVDGDASGLGKDSFAYDNQNRLTYAKFNSTKHFYTPSYASFTYDANNRIIKSLIKTVSNDAIMDEYIFAYRTDNKLDSIYSSGSNGGNSYKLGYNSAGKLIKITEYDPATNTSDFNYVITTDNNNNIIKIVSWDFGTAGDDLSYAYDAKSNPLAGYAFFFAGMDEINDLVTFYGPDNFITQTAKLDIGGGTIITVITGEKYDYNNCYPIKDYNSLNGVVIFPNSPDFIYTYK